MEIVLADYKVIRPLVRKQSPGGGSGRKRMPAHPSPRRNNKRGGAHDIIFFLGKIGSGSLESHFVFISGRRTGQAREKNDEEESNRADPGNASDRIHGMLDH
ncbi:MAG TPA: hypothetical protein VII90_02770, partial [Anaerolineales bacterium]